MYDWTNTDLATIATVLAELGRGSRLSDLQVPARVVISDVIPCRQSLLSSSVCHVLARLQCVRISALVKSSELMCPRPYNQRGVLGVETPLSPK